MALPTTTNAATQFQGLTNLPALRQLGLMLGLAASVAIGVAAVMWSQTPTFGLLYSGLSEKDTGLIIEVLQKDRVKYQLSGAGTIMVPSSKIHDVRIQLAAQGLPKGAAMGYETLHEDQGFGVSQFMELARYHRALEVEISRSIATLANIQSARVHLAIPKQSVFLRGKRKSTASVLVNLYSGRNLEPGQIAAIGHLVASSVPNLNVSQVTIVDQKGHLLTEQNQSKEMALGAAQFTHNRKLEAAYIERIEGILESIVGVGGVNAQVTVETDFTFSEQTQETFNPDTHTLRSSQTEENQSTGMSGGIPGALSNQPPVDAAVPGTPTGEVTAPAPEIPINSKRRTIQNYELDRTISHTRQGTGRLTRLSVAVVVDDKRVIDGKGRITRVSYSPEELQRFTGLVRKAVGYNPQRGDSISVINVPFSIPPEAEPLPEPSFWEQTWFQGVIKKALGGIVILALLLGVLRPVLRSLAQQAKHGGSRQLISTDQGAADQNSASSQPIPKLTAPGDQENVKFIQNSAQQEPKLVAQVVKTWVAADN